MTEQAWPIEAAPVDWASAALARIALGEACALVTLVAVEGSAPREAGAKMVVWAEGQSGAIGGGNLEYLASGQARRMLEKDAAFALQDYPLGPLLAQCCGGRVRVMLERLDAADRPWLAAAAGLIAQERDFEIRTRFTDQGLEKSVAPTPPCPPGAAALSLNGAMAPARGPLPAPGDELIDRSAPPRPRVILFGAGHVGVALARALAPLPFHLDWFDSRAEMGEIPSVTRLEPKDLAQIARTAGEAFTLILTHDHALDYALVGACLAGGGTGFVGVIGSRTKRARFLSRLRADGFDEAALARVTCPIGLAGLKGKAPEIIAVSVAADLLLRRQALLAAPQVPVQEPALESL